MATVETAEGRPAPLTDVAAASEEDTGDIHDSDGTERTMAVRAAAGD